MRKRPWRKDRIFRTYLYLYVAASTLLVWIFFRNVTSTHKAEMARLLERVQELENRPAPEAGVPLVSPPGETAETPAPEGDDSSSPPFFYLESTGYNGKWAYLDVEFLDGERRRYYFRPRPSKRELAELHRRLEHDAYKHYHYFVAESDEL